MQCLTWLLVRVDKKDDILSCESDTNEYSDKQWKESTVPVLRGQQRDDEFRLQSKYRYDSNIAMKTID